jgi:hypothetical protein
MGLKAEIMEGTKDTESRRVSEKSVKTIFCKNLSLRTRINTDVS